MWKQSEQASGERLPTASKILPYYLGRGERAAPVWLQKHDTTSNLIVLSETADAYFRHF